MVHVGDIGRPDFTFCNDSVYMDVANILKRSPKPVFVIPGDNDWSDCPDPVKALNMWRNYFVRFNERWERDFDVFYQSAGREENFGFVSKDILYIGLNIPGGFVHNQTEWDERHKTTLAWMKQNLEKYQDSVASVVLFGHANPRLIHKSFFVPLARYLEQFGDKPVLYLHGDGHIWGWKRGFYGRANSNSKILNIQVDAGARAPPIKVVITVHQNDTVNFQVDRRLGLSNLLVKW